MTQIKKIKKKKMVLTLIVGVYIALLISSSLFVPVKASIGKEGPDTVYGYCPIWELRQTTPLSSTSSSASEPPITVKINIIAWVIQYGFITLVFVSLLFRTLRHFKNQAC